MVSYNTPKISVVTVVLNGVATIEETIKSILSQEYSNIEIIVIDGGSTDGTLDVIKQYADKISYWESGLDSGIADAFNRGILKASGDLVAILNSDDQWLPNAAVAVAQAYELHSDADIFYANIQFIDIRCGEAYIVPSCIEAIKKRMSVFHPCLFIKKKTYTDVGEYSNDYKYAMDSHWVHRAIKYGVKFVKIDTALAQMQLGGVSDRHYIKSLNEYRRSLVENELLDWLTAGYYFLKYSFFKTIFRLKVMNVLKNKFYKRGVLQVKRAS